MHFYCYFCKIGDVAFYSISATNNQNERINAIRSFLKCENKRMMSLVRPEYVELSVAKQFDFICSTISNGINVILSDDRVVITDFLKAFQADSCRPFLYKETRRVYTFYPIIQKEGNLYFRDDHVFDGENATYIKKFLEIARSRFIYLRCTIFFTRLFLFLTLVACLAVIVALALAFHAQNIPHNLVWAAVSSDIAFVTFFALFFILILIWKKLKDSARSEYPSIPRITDEEILTNLKKGINQNICDIQALYKNYQLTMLAVNNFKQQSVCKYYKIEDECVSENLVKRIIIYTLNALHYKNIIQCNAIVTKKFDENQILHALYQKFTCSISLSTPAKGNLVFSKTFDVFDKSRLKKWFKKKHTNPNTGVHLDMNGIETSKDFDDILKLLRYYDGESLARGENPISLIDNCIECISRANEVKLTSFAYNAASDTYMFYDLALLASGEDPVKAKELLRKKLITELEAKLNMQIVPNTEKASVDNLEMQANVQIDIFQANSLKTYKHCLDLYQQNEQQIAEFIEELFNKHQSVIAPHNTGFLIEEFIAIAISPHITDSIVAEMVILKIIIASKEIDKEILQFFLPQIIKKLIKCNNVDWNYVLNTVREYITPYNAADIFYTLYDPNYRACLVILENKVEKYIYHFDHSKSAAYLGNISYIKAVDICMDTIGDMYVCLRGMDQKIFDFMEVIVSKRSELQQNMEAMLQNGEPQQSNQLSMIVEQKQYQLIQKNLIMINNVSSNAKRDNVPFLSK